MGVDMHARNYTGPEKVEQHSRHGHNDPAYFRLNWSGMSAMCDLMERAGALNEPIEWRGPKWPTFPGEEHFDCNQEREGGSFAALTPEGHAYNEATRDLREQVGENGVLAYKFSTNDGWLITPEECRIIAENLQRLLAEDDPIDEDSYWCDVVHDFVEYCERCAEHSDGFEVW